MEKMTGKWVHARQGPRSFSLMTEISEDRWRLIFAEIRCQVLTRHSVLSRTQRLARQLELTIASKSASQKSAQISEKKKKTSGLVFQPSPGSPSPSGVNFAAIALNTKKTYWNFPYTTLILDSFPPTALRPS